MILKISIHALVKRATYTCWIKYKEESYFNPRPRKEGDLAVRVACRRQHDISIHALVKRATLAAANISRRSAAISIHALVKRATSL